ncbi:MAG: ABC transporter permease subunit [Alphaproteobacteria bacterium]|nr:MAG: ABC transporter permease subunit [Alphaproteobacteria bacterium]
MVGASSLIGLLAAVEALIRAGLINRHVVPLPSQVVAALPRIIAEEDILGRFLMTAGEAAAAGLLLVAVAIPTGVLLHRVRLLCEAVESWIGAMAAAPLVLIYPLFLVIFGRNALTIVMIGFAAGLAPVILKTLEGLRATRPVLIDVGRSFKLSRAQQFWMILLPSALPSIFVGLRLGLIFALINVVGVEFLINFGGLGQLINDLAERYDLPAMYATIGFVILVSVVFFMSLERIERWLRPGQ